MKLKQALYAPIGIGKSTLAYRAVTFGYANARVKAMKHSLLTGKEISSLAAAKNVDEMIALLEKTGYRECLVQEWTGRGKEDAIELGITKSLEKTAIALKKLAPKEMERELKAVLARYDVQNIKTILLAKHLGKREEEILPLLLDAGNLQRRQLNEMLSLESNDRVIDYLGGIFRGIDAELLKELLHAGGVQGVLNAIDLFYYSGLLKNFRAYNANDRSLRQLLMSEIDRKNISSMLRGKALGMKETEIMGYIIPNGSVRNETLEKMAKAKNVEECVRILSPEIDLLEPLEKFTKDRKLSHFEPELGQRISRKSLAALRQSILSIGTIIGFLLLKEEEVKGIRKILRGKEFNLSEQEITAQLVGVGS